jgi:hypothetical protein
VYAGKVDSNGMHGGTCCLRIWVPYFVIYWICSIILVV